MTRVEASWGSQDAIAGIVDDIMRHPDKTPLLCAIDHGKARECVAVLDKNVKSEGGGIDKMKLSQVIAEEKKRLEGDDLGVQVKVVWQ